MKKLCALVVTIACLFLFSQVNAQSGTVTAKTATPSRGYKILNSEGTIRIYKYQHPAHSPKEAEKYKPTYFFTTISSDVLQPLTKDNLKTAFPENHPFHDALDATFDSNEDLTSYDSYHKMY